MVNKNGSLDREKLPKGSFSSKNLSYATNNLTHSTSG